MMRKESRILNYKSLDQTLFPISHLIFDLDNTLYPSSSLLADEMHQKMTEFVARYLAIPHHQAETLRRAGFLHHGTTLSWLIKEQGLQDPDDFLEFVHPSNISDFLTPLPKLKSFLDSLSLPKVILTNAPRSHAQRVLQFYEIESSFLHIFDLRSNNFIGKPHRSAYELVLKTLDCPAESAVFIDDIPAYLETFDTMGGHCILVDEKRDHGEKPWPTIGSIFELSRYLYY